MSQAELASRLEDSPQILIAFTGAGLLALAAFLSLTSWLVVRASQHRLSWSLVPPLRVPGTEVLALFLFLILLLMNDWTRPLALPLSLLGVIWLIRKSGATLTLQWGLDRLRPARAGAVGIWTALAALALIMPVAAALFAVLRALGYDPDMQAPVQMFLQAEKPWALVRLVLLAVIVAPVTEEVLFRGFLQPVLKGRLKAWGAILVTGALFAFVHFHAATFVQLFLLAIVLGAAYEITGSLLVSICLHAAFNATQASLLLLARDVM